MSSKIFNFLVEKIQPTTEQTRINQWLSESLNLVDLERRQRMLDNNQAPWQTQYNHILKGWM